MKPNYLSFFSGIGCFEYAIHQVFRHAHCIGYSEIDSYALKVYSTYYPEHSNLGDITKITESQIKSILEKTPCHLIVAGFPCQDLSSLAHAYGHKRKDLKGEHSGLFFRLKRILKWIYKYNSVQAKIIIENNGSMNQLNRRRITLHLKSVDTNFDSIELNGISFGVQRRKRIFWNNFNCPEIETKQNINTNQKWKDILLTKNDKRLESLGVSEYYMQAFNRLYPTNNQTEAYIAKPLNNSWYQFVHTGVFFQKSRWQMHDHSDTAQPHSIAIKRSNNNIIIRKNTYSSTFEEPFKVRKLHPVEIERLFFLPDGYVSNFFSHTRSEKLLGNGIIIPMIQYILEN
jgi:DNA (cytosine-5)-methyltransferase 1